jgi:hypothetical protein
LMVVSVRNTTSLVVFPSDNPNIKQFSGFLLEYSTFVCNWKLFTVSLRLQMNLSTYCPVIEDVFLHNEKH